MLAVTMVPRRSEMVSREVSCEGQKMSRAESELRKCLGSNTTELLLKSYSCAWQKEILVQGHLYITARHLCFYSSIIGFETKTTINVKDVTFIKKDKTAHLFPNAIVISTAEKRYGFSTFGNRNKSYDILQMVWQNETSALPMSQELLAAKIKLLKSKNKSVESSPVSTPHHQTRQLSLQRSSKSSGQTDSDSSGTSSPILLSRRLTPPPPGINLPPSHSHSDTVVGVAPRVVVTTSDSCADTAKTETIESRPESGNSGDSLFLDATDNRDFQLLNSNSGGRAEFSNLNSDSVDTSESAQREDMVSSTSSDSDVATEVEESWQKLSFMSSLCSSLPTAGRSPDTQFDGPREDSGIVFRVGRGEGGEEREGERDSVDQLAAGDEAGGSRVVSSVLQEVLGRVHIHPTRIGLWRLQRALHDWCTPSNFINLLIVISIFLLLISTASMLCRLSYMNPAFQPFVTWQPWCRLCSECRSSGKPHPPGGVAHDRAGGGERGGLWTLDFFEELVEKHGGNCEPPEVFDAGDKVSDNQHS